MLMKVLKVGGIGTALFVGASILGVGSYVKTALNSTANAVKNQVPVEFQIERAKKLVQDLVPDIRKSRHSIAFEEVQVQQIDERIANAENRLANEKTELLSLKSDLATGEPVFRYASRVYSADQVKTDLARRFERYKTNEQTLENLKKVRDARQKGLQAAKDKLESMIAARNQMLVEIEEAEARLKMVTAAETASTISVDDSNLSQARDALNEITARLNVREKMADVDSTLNETIPVNKGGEIVDPVDEVTRYFERDVASFAERN